MARQTTVILIDDLDGTEAGESLDFGLDGVEYEIDLNDEHAGTLRDRLAPFVASARRVGSRRRATSSKTTPTLPSNSRTSSARRAGSAPATVDREQNKAIREWAARHGHPLGARGRIPSAVSEAFHRGDPSALPSTNATTAPATTTPATTTDVPDTTSNGTGPTDADEKRGPDGLTASERETIRTWAAEEGIEVKSRGRLTKDLIANYRAVQARR